MSQRITEAAPVTEAATARDGGIRYRARLIEGDTQGSSGYYSREVLERDGPRTWAQGTQVFMDHPGEHERHDRPERSVRDLAGRIDSTPAYEGDGLYADVYIYPWAAGIVREMADDIGMSIRASATVESSNDPAIRGPVITSLTEGVSVDLVTRAGAGGKLVSLIESARRDPNVVVITEATSRAPQSVPAIPVGQSITTSPEEDPMADIEEGLRAQLNEATGRVQTLITERDAARTDLSEAQEAVTEATTRAEAAEARVAAFERRDAITRVVESVEGHGTLNALERRGIAAEHAEGDLDEDALRTAVEAAVAERAAQSGAGSITGFGSTHTTSGSDVVREAENAAAGAFGRTPKEA